MEILSNFSSVYCFISFILGAMFMLMAICIVAINKDKEPRNNVHFYVARDKNNKLWLYIGKPIRIDNGFADDVRNGVFMLTSYLEYLGINKEDYEDLKWEDEPVEVFINMED